MRLAIFAGLVAVSLAATSTALADPTASGIEVGLRTGYSLPLGSAAQGASLSDTISGRVPIWLDAGYRINPNIYVGAYFQYGIGFVASNAEGGACNQSGVSCSIHDIQLGAMFAYHLMPDQTIDPWLGIGFGYESASGSASAGGQSADFGFSGLQFANLQVGGDYKLMPNLALGPFLSFSLGEYSNATVSVAGQSTSGSINNTALHEWLTIGIRGAYDINLQ